MKSGEAVWYIVTDTDDKGNADQLGLNYSPKLTYADVGRAVRKATLDTKFKLVFEAGTVDFSPARSATPGDAPNFFPPKHFQPGSVGDKDYSPLVKSSMPAVASTTRRSSRSTPRPNSSTSSAMARRITAW